VYYHLGEFSLAMRYALGAGSLFNVFAEKNEFIETLVGERPFTF
jgi:hypothetical protein